MTPMQLFFHLENDKQVIVKLTRNLLILLKQNDIEHQGDYPYACITQIGYEKTVWLFTREKLEDTLQQSPDFLDEAYVGEIAEVKVALKWYHRLYTKLIKIMM